MGLNRDLTFLECCPILVAFCCGAMIWLTTQFSSGVITRLWFMSPIVSLPSRLGCCSWSRPLHCAVCNLTSCFWSSTSQVLIMGLLMIFPRNRTRDFVCWPQVEIFIPSGFPRSYGMLATGSIQVKRFGHHPQYMQRV